MTSPQWHRQVVCRPHEQETVRSSVRSGRRACPRGHRVGARTDLPTAATPPSFRRRQPRRAQNAREWLENRAPASIGVGPRHPTSRMTGRWAHLLNPLGIGVHLIRPSVRRARRSGACSVSMPTRRFRSSIRRRKRRRSPTNRVCRDPMVRACFRGPRTPDTFRRVHRAPRATGRCVARCGADGAGQCSGEHAAGRRHR